MPKFPVVGSEQECFEFSSSTDNETGGWWYSRNHSSRCEAISGQEACSRSCEAAIVHDDQNGASQNALADAVIRARIKANRPLDWDLTEDSDANGLVGAGHRWLHIRDAN